jgi:hypothetical protein
MGDHADEQQQDFVTHRTRPPRNTTLEVASLILSGFTDSGVSLAGCTLSSLLVPKLLK